MMTFTPESESPQATLQKAIAYSSHIRTLLDRAESDGIIPKGAMSTARLNFYNGHIEIDDRFVVIEPQVASRRVSEKDGLFHLMYERIPAWRVGCQGIWQSAMTPMGAVKLALAHLWSKHSSEWIAERTENYLYNP